MPPILLVHKLIMYQYGEKTLYVYYDVVTQEYSCTVRPKTSANIPFSACLCSCIYLLIIREPMLLCGTFLRHFFRLYLMENGKHECYYKLSPICACTLSRYIQLIIISCNNNEKCKENAEKGKTWTKMRWPRLVIVIHRAFDKHTHSLLPFLFCVHRFFFLTFFPFHFLIFILWCAWITYKISHFSFFSHFLLNVRHSHWRNFSACTYANLPRFYYCK